MTLRREWSMSLLSKKTEALLNVGIAATVGCDRCIDHHVEEAIEAGADRTEIRQTIELAREIGGKASYDCCDEAEDFLGPVDAAT